MKKQILILFGFVVILLPLMMIAPANTASGQDKTNIQQNNDACAMSDTVENTIPETAEEVTLKEKDVMEEDSPVDISIAPVPQAPITQSDINTDVKTYVVQPGDNLWKIAGEQINDCLKWQELYENNRELLGNDPNLIYPGQELILPITIR